jgi:hypothetical protein
MVDIVDGDGIAAIVVLGVGEVGRQMVEGGFERSELEALEQYVGFIEIFDRGGIGPDAELELAEREGIVPEAIHQNFLDPVPKRFFFLYNTLEFKLRFRTRADQF